MVKGGIYQIIGAVDDKIYVTENFGGRVLEYDVNENKWNENYDYLDKRDNFLWKIGSGMSKLDGRISISGGRAVAISNPSGSSGKNVEVGIYDIASKKKKRMSLPNSYSFGGVLNGYEDGKIFHAAGSYIEEYNYLTGETERVCRRVNSGGFFEKGVYHNIEVNGKKSHEKLTVYDIKNEKETWSFQVDKCENFVLKKTIGIDKNYYYFEGVCGNKKAFVKCSKISGKIEKIKNPLKFNLNDSVEPFIYEGKMYHIVHNNSALAWIDVN